ncbi:hypothetical protein [Methylobacterium nonmethylotrophicum]|uniref:Lipoprotein n=1 Tax=Methylobacterium nonmethylotrophicum TaxID=1141884 RepID=A0A4Z0NUZ1_9HYPH|nr:hypothetical protein [Methylobacterium nonmethylotrophicum]TGE00522.1 hypothetical protein EU555_07135 [Methylobacterium nonmethylotrophicum]
MIGRRRHRSILAALLLAMTADGALGTSASFRIVDPVPVALRDRIGAAVPSLRPGDRGDPLADAIYWRALYDTSGWLLLRVEANCPGDVCMTVIIPPPGEEAPPAIVSAKNTFSIDDYVIDLWGEQATGWRFIGADGADLVLYLRGRHWVVGPAPRAAWQDGTGAEEQRDEDRPWSGTDAKSGGFERYLRDLSRAR